MTVFFRGGVFYVYEGNKTGRRNMERHRNGINDRTDSHRSDDPGFIYDLFGLCFTGE